MTSPRRSSTSTHGTRTSIAVVVAVVVLLGGYCQWQRHQATSAVTDAARAGVPAVHWPRGHGTGQWDKDPWVRTLREAMTLLAVATNTSNFTDPALREIVSEEQLELHVQDAASMPSTYQPGPWPFAVLELKSTETAATIRVCETAHWAISDPEWVPTADSVTAGRGYRVDWELTKRADGTRHITDSTRVEPPRDLCAAEGTVVGYFDPAPSYGDARDPVTGPDGLIRERESLGGAELTVFSDNAPARAGDPSTDRTRDRLIAARANEAGAARSSVPDDGTSDVALDVAGRVP